MQILKSHSVFDMRRIVHDPEWQRRYCDYYVAVHKGEFIALGEDPESLMRTAQRTRAYQEIKVLSVEESIAKFGVADH